MEQSEMHIVRTEKTYTLEEVQNHIECARAMALEEAAKFLETQRFYPVWSLPDNVRALKKSKLETELAETQFRAETFESACTKALNERDAALREVERWKDNSDYWEVREAQARENALEQAAHVVESYIGTNMEDVATVIRALKEKHG